jgi:hypothetical protein
MAVVVAVGPIAPSSDQIHQEAAAVVAAVMAAVAAVVAAVMVAVALLR